MVSPIIQMTNTTKNNGMSGLETQLLVQHSAECPLRGGFAQSLTGACNADPSWIASWHVFVDPIARVRMVPWYLAAWHAGYANPFSIGIEIAGYARFSRAEWTTAEGQKQLANLAVEWAFWADHEDIPSRWLTTAEVRAVLNGNRSIKGFCTHAQIDPNSRTDPGPNFPYDDLMNRIRQIRATGNAAPATVPTKTPEPIDPFEELMGQIMTWYETKADFEDALRTLPWTFRGQKPGGKKGEKDPRDAYSYLRNMPYLVWAWKLGSRWKASAGQLYQAASYLVVNNAHSHENRETLRKVVLLLGQIAADRNASGDQIRDQIRAAFDRLDLSITATVSEQDGAAGQPTADAKPKEG